MIVLVTTSNTVQNLVINKNGFAYHLSEIEHGWAEIFCPAVLAFRADVSGLPVSVHDGLQDGGERSDSDAGADENRMLGPEDLACGGSEGSINVHLRFL